MVLDSTIQSHSGFQPLKEVWLGNCYPVEYYEVLPPEDRDFFQHITDITRRDLTKIKLKLEEFGIVVRQPDFDSIDKFLDHRGSLCKPPITPRDWALVLDDVLYVLPQYPDDFTGFERTINQYQQSKVKILDRSLPDDMCYLPFPSTVRVGRDIFIDTGLGNPTALTHFNRVAESLSKNYRVHVTHTGDHNDGIFCPIAAGQIFSTHYRTKYQDTFPGWDVFFLADTTKKKRGYGGNWWVEGRDYQIYSDLITRRAKNWLGDFRETIFEVNMLVIDEKNVLCIAEDDSAIKQMEKLGITPHVLDFQTRQFWDGGLHCLTVDIRRDGTKQDYWPERGPNGIYRYDTNTY